MARQTLPGWLRTLGRVMNIGIILLDPDQRPSFANEAACELLDCADLDALSRHWERFRPGFAETLRKMNRAGGEAKVEIQLKKGEATRHLELEIEPLLEDEAGGYLVVVKNKDLVHALENNLRYASKMRALARLFVSAVHDLKAPMNAISIHMELLKRAMQGGSRTDERDREKRTRLFLTVQTELQRLDRALTDVLNLALLPKDSSQRLDLMEVVQEVENLVTPMAREQRVAVGRKGGGSAILIWGHRDRFKQALLNIFLNALEAMPGGGQLEIEVTATGREARVQIRDTGPGMAPETLNRIWDLHFTTKEDGTGIGLHVSRTILEALGGAVHVESEVGHGTCFTVTLPVYTNQD